jgi:hypothetical protein
MKGTSRTFLIVLAMATILATMATGAAMAAKGGQGHHQSSTGGGSISLVMVTDANGDTLPNYGDQLTFTASTTATNRPFVALDCYKGGVRVYGFSAGIFPDYPWTQIYTLKSSMWTGGAADCTATGYYFTSNGREVIFATMGLPVGA